VLLKYLYRPWHWIPSSLRYDDSEIHLCITTSAASRIIAKIRNSLAGLTANPSLGRPGRVDGTRELVVAHAPYIAAYRIHENELQILAIIHTARLWPDTL
jgi:plasmid stabilization system protein ParE